MSLLNRMFTGYRLKQMLLIACFCLLAAAIWFLGPHLGFGEARPLEPVAGRVIFLLLTFLLLIGLWYRVPLFLLFALVACAVVWVIGPYFLIGKGYPLESAVRRGIIIAVIAFMALVWGTWLLIRALALNPSLLDKYTKRKSLELEDPLDQSEINAVIKGGVKYMRRIHRAVPLWRRFFFSSEWRAELPWYMVVGTQGVGKTSMIFSSGQDFPLPEQLSRKGKQSQPTANCECLYTNEALFLDTAGKFIAEGSSSEQEWTLLVNALKKHRPVRAINGVIVALSAPEILSNSKVDLLNVAAVIRSRLDELRHTLGVRFPVYVTITRMDQVFGFDEYFRNLTAIDREQIWGVTFPYGNEEKFTQDALKERITRELALLETRLNDAIPLRQQEEYAVGDRKRMYSLPQDFRLLSQCLADVLQNIFFASRYDETQFHSTLRGVYFLSNCQPESVNLLNNSTLMQRWRNVINQIRPQTPASLAQKREDDSGLFVPETSYGKQYFLKRLFSDVITRDRDLVSYNLKVESTWRLKNALGHLAAVVVTIWLVWAFIVSYQLNSTYLQAVATKLDALSIQVSQYVKTAKEQKLPALLKATQQLAEYDTLDLHHPALDWRYGLYTGYAVSKGSDTLYHFFLQRYLLPQLEEHAANALQKSISEGDDVAAYQALKSYLMLTGSGKFDANFLVQTLTEEWETSGAITPYEDSGIFSGHLTRLFSLEEWRKYGEKQDMDLIRSARALLAQDSSERRIWQQLKNQLISEVPENLSLRQMTGSQSSQVFTLDDIPLLQQGIPGIYTRQAFPLVKKKIITALVTLQQEASWVTGEKQAMNNPLVLREGVLTAYLQEYAAYWQRFLASVRLIAVDGQQVNIGKGLTLDIALLRTLISDTSPLQNLLRRAVLETTLSVQDKTLVGDMDIRLTNSRMIQQAKKVQQAVDYRERRLVREFVDDRFNALRNFVTGETRVDQKGTDFIQSQGTQLIRVMNILSDQYTRFVMYNSALEYGDIPPLSPDVQKFVAESQLWPDPIKNVVAPLLTRSYQKIENRVIKQSVQAIDHGPGEVCRNTLQGRYPFAESERSVTLNDFERFFAADGVVDSWFKRNLAAKVDTSTHPWRFKGSANTEGLAFFEAAAIIREAFFTESEGKKMALNFSASVHYLSPAITQFILNVDGENLRYSHGPVTTTDFRWPGERRGKMVSMTAQKQPASALPERIFQGPWAVLRWLNDADDVREMPDGKQRLSWSMGSDNVELEVTGLKYGRRSLLDLLRHFRCPDRMSEGEG